MHNVLIIHDIVGEGVKIYFDQVDEATYQMLQRVEGKFVNAGELEDEAEIDFLCNIPNDFVELAPMASIDCKNVTIFTNGFVL